MSDPEGNSHFCFPESPDVSRDEVEGNIRARGKTKLTGYPRLRVCVVVFIHKKENWQDLAVFFPPFFTPLSNMLLSRALM